MGLPSAQLARLKAAALEKRLSTLKVAILMGSPCLDYLDRALRGPPDTRTSLTLVVQSSSPEGG